MTQHFDGQYAGIAARARFSLGLGAMRVLCELREAQLAQCAHSTQALSIKGQHCMCFVNVIAERHGSPTSHFSLS